MDFGSSLTAPPGHDAPLEARRAWKEAQRANISRAGYSRTHRRDGLRVPTRIGGLPEFESEVLRTYLSQVSALRKFRDPAEIVRAAALAALYATGRSVETLTGLRVTTIPLRSSVLDVAPGLVCKGGHWGWWLPAGGPEAEQTLEAAQASQHQLTARNVWFPCGKQMKELTRRMLNARGVAWQHDGCRRLFPLEPVMLETLIREELRIVRLQSGSQITLGRVKGWLYDAVFVEVGNDHALAKLITGRRTPWDRAGGSYLSLPIETVAEIYVKAASTMDDFDEATRLPPELIRMSAGSRYRPLEDRLRSFAACHIEALADRELRRRSEIIKLHDAMTRYTLVMTALATGARHLRAIPSATQIDPATGFIALSDKRENRPELPVGYRTRLIWVCDEARQQITLYEAHLNALRRRYGVEFPPVGPDGLLPVCTLQETVDGTLRVQTLTPAALQKDLRDQGLNVRRNAGRHLLRSRLASRCPGEAIRAFMGHWEQGVEPWAGDAALDPVSYRRSMREIVPNTLLALGFKPTHGLQP